MRPGTGRAQDRRAPTRRAVLLRRAGRIAVWTSVLCISLVALVVAGGIVAWSVMRIRATRRHLVPAGTALAFPDDTHPRAPLLADAADVRAFAEVDPTLVRTILVVPTSGVGPHTAALRRLRAWSGAGPRAFAFMDPRAGSASEEVASLVPGLSFDEHVTLVALVPGGETRVAKGARDVALFLDADEIGGLGDYTPRSRKL